MENGIIVIATTRNIAACIHLALSLDCSQRIPFCMTRVYAPQSRSAIACAKYYEYYSDSDLEEEGDAVNPKKC